MQPTLTTLPTEPQNPGLRDRPTKLFVETTSRCNFSCAMCVKQSPGILAAEGDISAATFAALLPAMGSLEALVLNGLGEPLLHPQLENFISQARRQMPPTGWIGFQSNGLLLDAPRARALAAAGLDRVCLSVDASSPETFRSLREGGELQALEAAFSALRQAKLKRPGLQFGIEFVVMRQNLDQLCDTLRWAAREGARFALVSHLLPYAENSRSDVAYPDSTEVALQFFDRWRQKGQDTGIDLGRYYHLAWKYSRTEEEEQVINLVAAMRREAEQLGIFFNLKKLLLIDRAWLDRVETTFAEAEQVAADLGLDLRLPGVIPKAQRRCDFVEDGSAFINWDGQVHPCYFLWHSCSCHASGWEQQVQARSFGLVGEQTLLQIWNSPEFSSFRRSVLSYDYPFCYACTLAPCDYIQTEQFEQDCHVNGEPCGSCLWCMGLFQCLR